MFCDWSPTFNNFSIHSNLFIILAVREKTTQKQVATLKPPGKSFMDNHLRKAFLYHRMSKQQDRVTRQAALVAYVTAAYAPRSTYSVRVRRKWSQLLCAKPLPVNSADLKSAVRNSESVSCDAPVFPLQEFHAIVGSFNIQWGKGIIDVLGKLRVSQSTQMRVIFQILKNFISANLTFL